MKAVFGNATKFCDYVRIAVAVLFAVGCVSGCVNPPEPSAHSYAEPSHAPADYLDHVVKYSGETLAVIAKHYTGKTTNWKAIQDANPGLRPERIRLGQTIRIPRTMVITEEPLPRTSVPGAGVPKTDGLVPPVTAPDGSVIAPGVGALPTDTAVTMPITTGEQPVTGTNLPTEVIPSASQPAVLTPPVEATPPASGAGAEPNDAEREKLLDELLKE